MGLFDRWLRKENPAKEPAAVPPAPPATPVMDRTERFEREAAIYMIIKNLDVSTLAAQFQYKRYHTQQRIQEVLNKYAVFPASYDEVLAGKRDAAFDAAQPGHSASIKKYVKELRLMDDRKKDMYTTMDFSVDVPASQVEEARKTFGLVFSKPGRLEIFSNDNEEEVTAVNDFDGQLISRLVFSITEPELEKLGKLQERHRDTGVEMNMGCRERLTSFRTAYCDSFSWQLPTLAQLLKVHMVRQDEVEEAGRTALNEGQRELLLQAAEDAMELRLTGGEEGEELAKDKLERAFFEVVQQKRDRGQFRS